MLAANAAAQIASSGIPEELDKMDTSSFSYQDITDFVRLGRESLDLIRAAIPLIPKGKQRDELENKLSAAQEALNRSDARLAKELGLHLCDCTFPPQIMLWRENEHSHICPRRECGRKIESPDAPKNATKVHVTGVKCAYCGGDTTLIQEREHDHFSFAGWKNHVLKCTSCDKQSTRPWSPDGGYKLGRG
jgi:hypothetical protein